MKTFFYLLATDQVNNWQAKILRPVLWVLSLLYSGVVSAVAGLYQMGVLSQKRLPCPVICVGNITVGGSGKTPLVQYLAYLLKAKGLNPVILIRGYMDQGDVSDASKSDEARMLKEVLKDVPILVGKNRFESAQNFLKENEADVFIMDDGFQHWKLFRDLDIVVINSVNPFGNQHVLPRGILREPLSSLKRTKTFVLSHCADKGVADDLGERIKKISQDASVIQTHHKPTQLHDLKRDAYVDFNAIKEKAVCLLSSIGSPEMFGKTVKTLQVKVIKHFIFADHYEYSESDIQDVLNWCHSNQVDVVLTTAKDAVKIRSFLYENRRAVDVYSVNIVLDFIKGEDVLIERINSVIHS